MKGLWNVVLSLLSIALCCDARLGPRQEINQTALSQLADLDLPECGGLCYVQVFPDYGCSVDDPSCLCSNNNLTTAITACLVSNCTVPQQLEIEKVAKDLCGAIFRDRGIITVRITWSLFALALIFVGARFIARPERLHGSGYGTDDWTILLCMALLIPFNALVQLMVDNGLGTDNFTLSPMQITLFLKYFFAFTIIYTILVMVTKVSILQLYLRIWTEDATSIWFRRVCWFLIAVHVVTIVAFVFAEIFSCGPVSFGWTFWDGLHDGYCINRSAELYALGAINICYDVVVFILPLHNFLKLNISWRRKTGVLLIFMVGLLVTICSIVRLQYLVKIGVSRNPSWDYNNAVIWSSVECNFSVVCTCMPAMAGLLQRIWAKLSGKPMSSLASSNGSRAPIRPHEIDPEKPMSGEEMLKMRQPGSFEESPVVALDASDPNAATAMKEKGSPGTSPTSLESIELRHEPPSQTTATRLAYRDVNGRLHEVKVIDKPLDDVQKNAPAGEESPRDAEKEAKRPSRG
ncbi:unnamed protein product [Cercospora beticola]|nr:unnamed protein product [Cercospora beticola]